MRIVASDLQLTSSHQALQRDEKREQLRYWRDGEAPVQTDSRTIKTGLKQMAERLREELKSGRPDISPQGARLQPQRALLKGGERQDADPEEVADLKMLLVKALLQRYTGRDLKLFSMRDLQVPASQTLAVTAGGGAAVPAQGATPETQGWGLVYDSYQAHVEEERTSFSTTGLVRTADGQEIAVDLQLNLSRRMVSEQQLTIRAGDALKDPLVVNFAGNAAQLTQTQFSFDLDQDGRAEQISFVGPGSGFLALDRNGDGAINHGGELFGATSGDGFAELATLDADGNGWVDEADPLYQGLRIWTKDEAGNDYLTGLGERGIGALYLGRVATPFKLTGDFNETLGQVRSSGLYLSEDGSAGSLQQIDLKV